MRDLFTEVSWNYEINQCIRPLKPKSLEPDNTYRMQLEDIELIQEFHKCIEFFLCQNVCRVMRDQQVRDFAGTSFLIRIAFLAMHPPDILNHLKELKNIFGISYCNITKCCTEVCPEHIGITDNGIIPLKERVAGDFYEDWPEYGEA